MLSRFAGEFVIMPFASRKPRLLELRSKPDLLNDDSYLPKGCVFSFLTRMDRRGETGDRLRKKLSVLSGSNERSEWAVNSY